MLSSPQRFVLLRDRPGWSQARLTGLEPDEDGALALAGIPGVADGAIVDLPGPYDPPLAGFALSPCAEVALASASDGRVLVIDPRCAERKVVIGADAPCDGAEGLHPAGLAATRERLFVADPDAAAVRAFALPGLEPSALLSGPLLAPVAVAVDGLGRLYVLDAGRRAIFRFDARGLLDRGYTTGAIPDLAGALSLVVVGEGAAFVAVAGAAALLRFGADGKANGVVDPPAADFRPGALAADGAHLYAADRAIGALWTYALAAERWLAAVPRFRAPVRGLAVDGEGHLYVRTEADVSLPFLRLDAGTAHVGVGWLEAGPFDAGERVEWMRVHLDAQVPAGTRVWMETALAAPPDAGPLPAEPPPSSWKRVEALDALVWTPGPADRPADPEARLLFVRVHVETDVAESTPLLRQITAETPGDDYLARLPAVYAAADAGRGFLRRWLEAFRAELGDRELDLDALAARFDPATTPAADLPWLASWIACELPSRTASDVERRRQLLLDMHRIQERRGTVAGLREMVRIYTGLDCHIVETYRDRALWVLDGGACLGLNTGLLPALPDGMVVPGPSLPDPALQGLSVQYFFEGAMTLPAPTMGADIDPDGSFPSLASALARLDAAVRDANVGLAPPLQSFSAVWTGQIRATNSALVTFYLAHTGGARLYIDDDLIIDDWTPLSTRTPRGALPLDAGHWYAIRIEYWWAIPKAGARQGFLARPPGGPGGGGIPPVAVPPRRLELSWSAPGQPRAIVSREHLYAQLDDDIDPDARPHDGSPDHLIVGEAVVGEHGPLAAEDFGAPLFADAAHHFTVRVPAREARRAGALDAVRAVLDAEKPAHTHYHLCVIEPTFVVGRQARVGVDAVVAHPPPAGRYDQAALGRDARLGVARARAGTLRVEENLRIGANAILR